MEADLRGRSREELVWVRPAFGALQDYCLFLWSAFPGASTRCPLRLQRGLHRSPKSPLTSVEWVGPIAAQGVMTS